MLMMVTDGRSFGLMMMIDRLHRLSKCTSNTGIVVSTDCRCRSFISISIPLLGGTSMMIGCASKVLPGRRSTLILRPSTDPFTESRRSLMTMTMLLLDDDTTVQ